MRREGIHEFVSVPSVSRQEDPEIRGAMGKTPLRWRKNPSRDARKAPGEAW